MKYLLCNVFLLCCGTGLLAASDVALASTSESVIQVPKDLCIFTTDYLIGGFGNGKWLSLDEVRPFIRGGEAYKRYSENGYEGDAPGGKALLQEGPGEWFLVPPQPFEGEVVDPQKVGSLISGQTEFGVSCSWNPQPRKSKAQGVTNPTYLNVVKEILKENGLKADPLIQELVRFDLEGDGVDEVLIIASNANASIPAFKKNTYTLVVFRQVIAGKVVNTILQEEYYREDRSGEANSPSSYAFGGVLDLNGDGVLELILRSGYYEGGGVEVHALEGKKLKIVLREGVGA